jgi:asparagine synthase (glutamine-hydrolysing)
MLAREVHARGYKVALTGEGADEWMPGYPWYKMHKLASYLDVIPGLEISQWLRRAYLRFSGVPDRYRQLIPRSQTAFGGHNAWLDVYGLMSRNKWLFFSPHMIESLGDHLPHEDLQLNLDKMRRWHPLNRALCVGGRVHLVGLLLSCKGDRVAMHSSVETRYPFLDEEVYSFLAQLHPRWKLRGFTEKYLLRKLAERYLPPEIAWRRKAMFMAPFDSFHAEHLPPFVDQLLSEEALRKTGYFDVQAVQHWRQAFRHMRAGSFRRTFIEMGLVAVVATQLWHQTFLDPSLADVPQRALPFPSGSGLAKSEAVVPSPA